MLIFIFISLFFVSSESQSPLRSSVYVPQPIGLPNSRPIQPPPRPVHTRPRPLPKPPADDLPYIPPGDDPNVCPVGDYIPGPTCTSFYMCTGNLYAAGKVQFECAPGTAFDDRLNVCVAGIASACLLELLGLKPTSFAPPTMPPAPPPPSQVYPPGVSPVPSPVALPPAPAPSPTAPPSPIVPPASSTCSSYVVEPGSAHNCVQPGNYPFIIGCQLFFKCIITSPCRLIGVIDQCPLDYLFDTRTRMCQRKEQVVCNVSSSSLK